MRARRTWVWVRAMTALLVALTGLAVAPTVAVAVPVASFSFAPERPTVGAAVAFTFTGSCDDPPCRVQWRWFQDGGSSLGNAMGEGLQVSYPFDRAGSYRVVVRITNAGSTHGSASATRVVTVAAPTDPPDLPTDPPAYVVQDDDRAMVLDGWAGVDSPRAGRGGFHLGHGRATMSFSGRSVTYVAVTGPALGIAAVSLDGGRARFVDLYSPAPGRRSVTLRTPPGRHQLSVRSTGRRSARSTGTAVSIDDLVVAGRDHVDDRSPQVTYGRWSGHRLGSASGGTVRVATEPGATLRMTFAGPAFSWVTSTGPQQGRARVVVDGVVVATVDNRAASPTYRRVRTFDGLTPGRHRAAIVVLPDGRPATTRVTVDAFRVVGGP